MLLSWLYALYSFDYKWSLTNMPLTQRIAFFENHWAFFNGARLWQSAHACLGQCWDSATIMPAV